MSSVVYFVNIRSRGAAESTVKKIERLYDAAGLDAAFKEKDLAAVKLHFGERGGDAFLRPMWVRAVIDKMRQKGVKPFLTDTNTMYSGSRFNAVDHCGAAVEHGFAYSVVNAPVLVADGLFGENYESVPVDLRHFKSVKIAGAIRKASSMMVLSHFKGHILAGFGGAIKNVAMGCAPFAGKAEQHSPRFEVKQEKCSACGNCVEVCPAGAAHMQEQGAYINKEECLGCGECMTQCPEDAIGIDFKTEIPKFMERMTEYAYGALKGKEGRVAFINFVVDVTPDCDCVPWSDSPIVPDVGIVAGFDPVAVDQASYDLVNKQQGFFESHLSCNYGPCEDKFKGVWSSTMGELQLTYGEKIGLGATSYTLEAI